MVAERGGRVVNLDLTIVCERPRIGPHVAAMKAAIAEVCGIGEGRVAIKATTSEQLGFTGREEGLVAMATASIALTDVPGSSEAVHGGFITYANEAKEKMIGVPAALITAHGAVSEQVARAMAEGALKATGVAISVAVTGIAGPGGGTEGKPVGLVHFACATADATIARVERFGDRGRQEVREVSVITALDMVIEALGVTL
jgi:nicotinamide-nucleotide amidase